MTTAQQEEMQGRLVQLDRERCMQLLRMHSVGRVAVDDGAGPVVFPVNYQVHGGTIVFRTGAGTKLGAALRREAASFEIDEINPRQRTGWSVLVRGRLTEVEGAEQIAELWDLGILPYASGGRERFVRLTPSQMTGVRIEVPPGVSRDPDHAPELGNVWSGQDGDDLLA